MKKKYLLSLFAVLITQLFIAQTTEDFETETIGSTSFTDNGQVFNITTQAHGPFNIETLYANTGWNGTAIDNTYIDNSDAVSYGPVEFTIATAGGTPFNLKSLWLYLTKSNSIDFNITGSCTITGKLAGTTVFTASQSTGFATGKGATNGFTSINMTTYGGSDNSNATIDSYIITTTGNIEYVALDAMNWQKITCPAVVVIQAPQTNVACNGSTTGAAAVNASGGTGLTYEWSPGTPTGDGTASVTGLSAGTWTCKVTNSCGSSNLTSFTISQPTALVATAAAQTNVSCNSGSNGSATVSASNGTPGYSYSWAPSGGTAATATGLSAGIHTVTVTDANGCTATKSFTITQPSAINLTPASQTNISCNGGSNGAATVNTPTGGTGGYTYNWTPGNPTGDGTAAVTGLMAGAWTCTVTDANACTTSQSFIISQPSGINLTPASQTNIACFGGSTGAAAINTPTGGAGGYTYNWSPGTPTGDGTTAVTGLIAGTWTCTVTDANGCTKTQNFTVTQPPAITITPASQTNIACFGGFTGAAAINTPTGGTGGYTYNWTPGNPTGDGTTAVSGLTAGTWTCTVTDANACTTSQSFTITQPSPITLTPASQTNISCNSASNGAATVNTPTGGAGGYTYNWTPGNPTGDGTAAVSGLTAGTWTCTVTDANACTASQSFTITQPSAITLTPASQTNISCNSASNGAATVNTPTGGAGGYTYNWTPGNPAGDGTKSVTGLTAGTWTCTVTDANSCTASQSFTITEPTSLTANITTQTNSSCNGSSDGSATVAASGGTPGYTYSWAPVGGTAATAVGLAQGNYAVTITDANYCSVLKFIYIGVNPDIAAPVADVTTLPDINSYCSISSVEITVPTATDNCRGSISATTSDPLDYTSEGNYVINWNYNDGNGNSASQTQKINILASPLATVSLSDSEFTYDGNLHAIQVANLPTGANVTYAILPATGSGNGAINTGSYAVTATVTPGPDAINCGTVVLTASLSIIKALQATTSQTNVSCNGASNGSATAVASGGKPGYAYSWAPSGGTAATATGLSDGTYTVTITDAKGSNISKIFTITQPTALEATISQTNVSCNGGSNGSATVTASGGTAGYTYSWSPSGGTAAAATGLSAGTYIATITDANGCTALKSFIITQPTALSGYITSQTNIACNGDATGASTVTVTGGTAPYSYAWSNAATTATITGVTAGTYTVTATDANGCTSATSVTITQPTVLSASIASQTNVACNGGANGSSIVTVTGGTAPYTYLWSNGATTATIAGVSAGTYTVTATDANGCASATSVTITEPTALSFTTTTLSNYDYNTAYSQIIEVSGGTGVKSYAVTTGSLPTGFALSANGTLIGTSTQIADSNFTVTTTDSNGCSATYNYILKLSQIPITVTANVVTKVYGDTNPILTYTVTPNLESGDSFTGNLTRNTGEKIGNYTINAGTLSAGSKYLMTYVSNDFRIIAKPITVTAKPSQTKVYGAVDPIFVYSVSTSLISGDSFTGALTRVAGENAGSYTIGQGNLSAGPNYTISYVGTDFSITKADQIINWNQIFEFGCDGQTVTVLTATSSSGLAVSYSSSNSNIAKISNGSLVFSDYGSTTITASQAGNLNYNPASVVLLPVVNSQPNLIKRQFENVIFFDNSSKNFRSYSWYKNGVLVAGQTAQYFKENGALNGTYYAVATKFDGTLVTTCPLVLSPTLEEEYIKIVPNPVKANASYELITNVESSRLKNAHIEVFSISGLLLENKIINENTVNLVAPNVEGIYIVKMTLANGKNFTKNLLIKN